MKGTLLVLDFGSQYTQLIARRSRELGVYSEIRPCHTPVSAVELEHIGAIVLSGGPASVYDSSAPEFDPRWLETGKPTLGICYGMQLIAHLAGGRVAPGNSREFGPATVEVERPSGPFSTFPPGTRTPVWMSHGDYVAELPPGFEVLASSPGAPVAAMGDRNRKIYALQFHPEVVHTPRGKEVLGNFLFSIAGIVPNWSPANFIQSSLARVQSQVGPKGNVLCALSGGVDSTVAAVLVAKAIGSRLHCIFVDNGLLRKDEAEKVMARLGRGGLNLNITLVKAGERFLTALKGVSDPEQKRKIIGRVFIEVFEEETKRVPDVEYLVQGTLYPDVIESVSVRGPSATIKTHHNVGGLPERMKLKLVEPFRELFKDEVRQVGIDLGVPREIIRRQPFPGPGLAVRVLGEVTEDRLAVLREADQIFLDEIRAEGLYEGLWQSFAVLLPVKSVGVMGDGRTYEQALALRAVHSEDGMTADWAFLPEPLLRRVSNRIINEVRGINRVVLDISSKPPSTIEWE